MNPRLLLVLALSTFAGTAWAQGPKTSAPAVPIVGTAPVASGASTTPGTAPVTTTFKLAAHFMASDALRFNFASPSTCVTLSGSIGPDKVAGIKIYGPGRRSPYFEGIVADKYSFNFKRPPKSLAYSHDFIAVVSNFVGVQEIPGTLSAAPCAPGALNMPAVNTATVGRPPVAPPPTVAGGYLPMPGAGPPPAEVLDKPAGASAPPTDKPGNVTPLIITLVHGKTGTLQNDRDSDGKMIEHVNTHEFTRYYWGFDFICNLLGVTNGELYTYSGLKITKDKWYVGYAGIPATEDNLMLVAKPLGPDASAPARTVMLTFRDGSQSTPIQGQDAVDQIFGLYANSWAKRFPSVRPDFVLVGHSMGGVIGRWILRKPEASAKTAFTPRPIGGRPIPERETALKPKLVDPLVLASKDKRGFLRDSTRYLVTLATPHEGSEALQKGWDIMKFYRGTMTSDVRTFIQDNCAKLSIAKAVNLCKSALGGLADTILADLDRKLEDLTGTAGAAGAELTPSAMAVYNKALLDPANMARADGSSIPVYALSGHTPDMNLFGPGIQKHLASQQASPPAAVASVIGYLVWNVLDFYFSYYVNIPFTDDDLEGTYGSADPKNPDFKVITDFGISAFGVTLGQVKLGYCFNRFKIDALKLVVADGVLHLPALATQSWGAPGTASQDRVKRSKLFLGSGPLASNGLLSAIAASYANGQTDASNDADGLVGFNSGMHAPASPIPTYDHRNGGNWYSVHDDPVFNRQGGWFPWDLENHRNICFSAGLGDWLRKSLFEDAGYFPKPNALSSWKP